MCTKHVILGNTRENGVDSEIIFFFFLVFGRKWVDGPTRNILYGWPYISQPVKCIRSHGPKIVFSCFVIFYAQNAI